MRFTFSYTRSWFFLSSDEKNATRVIFITFEDNYILPLLFVVGRFFSSADTENGGMISE